jgi:hypothetical protein
MMSALEEIPAGKVGGEISRIAGYAARLSETTLLRQLVNRAQAMPQDHRYYSRSEAIADVVLSLAKLGETDYAWSLSANITEEGKRLEVYVDICEFAHCQGKVASEHFNKSLAFARQVENVGMIPTQWGKLALLAHQLGYRDEEEECVDLAIEGTRNVVPSHHIGFNVYNSANVARYLHQIELSSQAHSLLQFGLSHVPDAGILGIDPLRVLIQAMAVTQAVSLWHDVLQFAQVIEDDMLRVQVLLGITHAMAQSGDRERAIENLPLVLDAVQEANGDKTILVEFSSILGEFLQPDSRALNDLIASAFRYARSKDRPTVLTLIAGLLPVFAKADPALAAETWSKLKQADAMLGAWNLQGK